VETQTLALVFGSHQNKESLLCSRFSFRNNEELVYLLFTIVDLLTGMESGYVHKYCFYIQEQN
jgi:hypothetical protein